MAGKPEVLAEARPGGRHAAPGRRLTGGCREPVDPGGEADKAPFISYMKGALLHSARKGEPQPTRHADWIRPT